MHRLALALLLALLACCDSGKESRATRPRGASPTPQEAGSSNSAKKDFSPENPPPIPEGNGAKQARIDEILEKGLSKDGPVGGFDSDRYELKMIIQSWLEEDPVAALQMLALIKDEGLQVGTVGFNRDLAVKVPVEVINFLEQSVMSRTHRRQVLEVIFQHLGASDRELGLQLLKERFGPGRFQRAAIGKFFRAWPADQPGAMQAALGFEHDATRRTALREIQSASAEDLAMAREMGVSDEIYGFVLKTFAMTEVRSNPTRERVLGVFQDHPELTGHPHRHELLTSLVIPMLQNEKFSSPAELQEAVIPFIDLGAVEPGDYGSLTYHCVSPSQREEFFALLPANSTEAALVALSIAGNLLRSSQSEAIEWASSLPAGRSRDRALGKIIYHAEKSGNEPLIAELRGLLSEEAQK